MARGQSGRAGMSERKLSRPAAPRSRRRLPVRLAWLSQGGEFRSDADGQSESQVACMWHLKPATMGRVRCPEENAIAMDTP